MGANQFAIAYSTHVQTKQILMYSRKHTVQTKQILMHSRKHNKLCTCTTHTRTNTHVLTHKHKSNDTHMHMHTHTIHTNGWACWTALFLNWKPAYLPLEAVWEDFFSCPPQHPLPCSVGLCLWPCWGQLRMSSEGDGSTSSLCIN
jgi:hypothetical protein